MPMGGMGTYPRGVSDWAVRVKSLGRPSEPPPGGLTRGPPGQGFTPVRIFLINARVFCVRRFRWWHSPSWLSSRWSTYYARHAGSWE
jgi:hypothetical protein